MSRLSKEKFWGVLLFPYRLSDTIISFISGIMLSAAINIATSQLPNSIWDNLPINIIISMILMVLASILLILLAVYLKPYQDAYKSTPKAVKESRGLLAWTDVLNETKNAKKIILILGSLSIIITVLSFVLIVVPSGEIVVPEALQ